MKWLTFLLLISFSVFSKTENITIYNKTGFIFIGTNSSNNSSYYNLKKTEEKHQKSSFKQRVKTPIENVFTNEIKTNTSNTLQTLIIKLDSVQKLHEKGFLKKEVLVNTSYYQQFLSELQNSSINNHEYVFLENELLKINVITIHKKYQSTFNISLVLGFIIIFMLLYFFLSNNKKTIVVNLTKQEIVIKEMIIDGKTNKEIANELHISLNTVKTHVSNIYQKLNISKRTDLILKFKNSPSTST